MTNGRPATKQVERSSTDPNMIVSTYSSEHNHPCPTQRNALTGSSSSFSNPSSKSSALTTSASSSVSQNQDETNKSHFPTFAFPSYLSAVVKKDDVEECQDKMEYDNDFIGAYSLGVFPGFQHPEDFWDDHEGDSPTILPSHNSGGGNMENKATSSDVFSDVTVEDSSSFIPPDNKSSSYTSRYD